MYPPSTHSLLACWFSLERRTPLGRLHPGELAGESPCVPGHWEDECPRGYGLSKDSVHHSEQNPPNSALVEVRWGWGDDTLHIISKKIRVC